MTYFIDFYGTAFDTAAFDAYRKARPAAGEYAPGELAPFLYPDARGFLLDKGNSAMVLTSASEADSGSLIKSALHGIPRIAVIYTNGAMKGDYLAPHIDMYGQSPVFVDDSADQLANMAARCPNVRVHEMRRDGGAGSGSYPVVSALSQLP
ncbi:MAG TPA: hypothetical protein VHO23_02075 [Candidatus Paceibacterota bacterium]|nr:hypothetical protein [Candidatus Paceibacterota bacterium]